VGASAGKVLFSIEWNYDDEFEGKRSDAYKFKEGCSKC
jgi:hypothetical protein